ncbi:hypothetical protein GCM10027299_28760 [Larkinella ripae]
MKNFDEDKLNDPPKRRPSSSPVTDKTVVKLTMANVGSILIVVVGLIVTSFQIGIAYNRLTESTSKIETLEKEIKDIKNENLDLKHEVLKTTYDGKMLLNRIMEKEDTTIRVKKR